LLHVLHVNVIVCTELAHLASNSYSGTKTLVVI